MLNDIGSPATLTVRGPTETDDYGNDVPTAVTVPLENVFVYTGGGDSDGDIGQYLMVESDATALLPIGTASMLDEKAGHHSLMGATLTQGGTTYDVVGNPLPYPDGTSPFSWEWKVPLKAVVG